MFLKLSSEVCDANKQCRGGETDEAFETGRGLSGSGVRTGGKKVCGDIVKETWLLPLLLLLLLSCSVRRLDVLLLVASVRYSEL